MGEYFTVFFADGTRMWIASSEGGDLYQLSGDQAQKVCELRERHETEEQTLLRNIFTRRVN